MKKYKYYLFFILLFFLTGFIFVNSSQALVSLDKYPRLASYYLPGTIKKEDYAKLAKYDLVIIQLEAQYRSPDLFAYLRQKNPDIIILGYVLSQCVDRQEADLWPYLKNNLYERVDSNWWLRDQWGNQINYPYHAVTVNVCSGWNTFLPSYVNEQFLSTGKWDGIFYDVVDDQISYSTEGNVDLNNDGQVDSAITVDQKWRSCLGQLFTNTREVIGEDKIIVINGSSYAGYQPSVNGRMLESFPTPWEGQGTWLDSMKAYFNLPKQNYFPPIQVIAGDTNNTGQSWNFQKMRFGLASALLADGYYGFDYGINDHSQLWWYDEYDVNLNRPLSQAYDVLHNNSSYLQNGVWRRDFKDGIAIVNSTAQEQSVKLGAEFEKIRGRQDQKQNDGSVVDNIKLQSEDGIILLRPITEIIGEVFHNGSFARVFNSRGEAIRNGFFAYNQNYSGNSQIIVKDLDNDNRPEITVAGKSQVDIFNAQGKKLTGFYPYGQYYNLGINLAIGDLDNNGTLEIVTGTQGGGPQIRIFNKDGKLINPGFFAYDLSFRGGVNVAVGDLNGDGWGEIVAGAGTGGGPHIRIFGIDGRLINPGFFAYNSAFRGGVNVATGDLDGNGTDEIIAGAGSGGGPHIRIFNKDGKLINSGWFAFDQNNLGGVKVSAQDINKDGKDEIIGMTTNIFPFSNL
ncbi:MAG: putative glycoside hydrolase [bacterium]